MWLRSDVFLWSPMNKLLLNVDRYFFFSLHCLSSLDLKIRFFRSAQNSEEAFSVSRVKKQGFAFAYVFFSDISDFMFFHLTSINLALEFVYFFLHRRQHQQINKKKYFYRNDLQPQQSSHCALVFKNVFVIVM